MTETTVQPIGPGSTIESTTAPPKLAHVEQIRDWLIFRNRELIVRMRSWLGFRGDNPETIEVLSGDSAQIIIAAVVETWLRELGHKARITADNAASRTRRAVKRSQTR